MVFKKSVFGSALLAALVASSPLLVERQAGQSPCFGEPGDRCPPGTYCQGSLRPINFQDCRDLLAERSSSSAGICAAPNSCRVWNRPGCRVGFCNSESRTICHPSDQLGAWGTEGADQCDPDGGTFLPDTPEFIEVYFTAPLNQQELISEAQTVERTMSLQQFRAENAEIAAQSTSSSPVLERRQQDGDEFVVNLRRTAVTLDGTSTIVSNELPDGSTWASSQAQSITFGIEASVSLDSGFFTSMTAGAGVSVGASFSTTNQRSETETIPIKCEGACGLVEFFMLYDCYGGNFQPSGDAGNFCVPNETGRYGVRCIGCGF